MADISWGLRARTLLARAGFRPQHSLGQNFLLDDDVLEHLIDLSGVGPDDHVLEIGPGPGVMTRLLAGRVRRVTAVEIDRALEPVLSEMLSGVENAEVVYRDAMKADLSEFVGGPSRVVANLPYYITADAVLKVLLSGLPVLSLSVMVQREAAERMLSQPGDKNWCLLAATVSYFADAAVLAEIPPEAFEPRPHVASPLLHLDVYREKPVKPRDEALFLKVLAAAFAMRRKTLVNNLKAAFDLDSERAKRIVRSVSEDERVRGEALTLQKLAEISDRIGAL